MKIFRIEIFGPIQNPKHAENRARPLGRIIHKIVFRILLLHEPCSK